MDTHYEMNDSLYCVGVIDGRYKRNTYELRNYFSEYALMKYRIEVELKYLLELSLRIDILPEYATNGGWLEDYFEQILFNFNLEEAKKIKEIEKITLHDVKAIEYYIRKKFDEYDISYLNKWIHFGLTSQDTNSPAQTLQVKRFLEQVYSPKMVEMLKIINNFYFNNKNIVMLGKTHGQIASPTSMGKEFMVYHERLENQLKLLGKIDFNTKFGGAVGNLNAHLYCYPDVNWKNVMDSFIQSLGMIRQQFTTQIDHYDNLCAIFHNIVRINNILIDFSRDIWLYTSIKYLLLRTSEGQIGSSTMPHKINPINFENAEGNLSLANSLFTRICDTIPVSRYQRDLSNSTISRNFGTAFGYTMIAYDNLITGLSKLLVNNEEINKDLDSGWAVLLEALQTYLRTVGLSNAYELVKNFYDQTPLVNKESLSAWIDTLNIGDNHKDKLKNLSPETYTGYH